MKPGCGRPMTTCALFLQRQVQSGAMTAPISNSSVIPIWFLHRETVRHQSTSKHPGPSSLELNRKRTIGTAIVTSMDEMEKSSSNMEATSSKRGSQPIGAWRRFRSFPNGVKLLFYDCLRYKNIHDASKTRLNAWTINHPYQKHHLKTTRNFFIIYDDELRPGRIPRRQYEEQRRTRLDIRTMLPLIIIWIPPIIGVLPPILAVTAPRQVLSRQFHGESEVEQYAQIEYKQRESVYQALGDMFWGAMQIHPKSVVEAFEDVTLGEDAAGPIVDPMILYSAFLDQYNSIPTESDKSNSSLKMPKGQMISIDDLPREYLVRFQLVERRRFCVCPTT